MCEFDKLDKTLASDLYLIYKRSPSARVCISDTDQLLMFYLSLINLLLTSTAWSLRENIRPRSFMYVQKPRQPNK